MIAEFISVGTELLLGNIVNTNAWYLSRKCAELGFSVYYQNTVGDNEERLKSTIELALSRSDLIFLTGGLGPTEDDLTKETVAKTIGKPLVEAQQIKEQLQDFFRRINREATENNWKQAMVIEGAVIIQNENGTAPGQIVDYDDKKLILMPGPPNEMIPMFERGIYPILACLQKGVFYSEMVKLCGIGESQVETMILDLIGHQTNPTIAPYAKTGEVHLRVTASAKTKEEGKQLVIPTIEELKKRFGSYIFTLCEEETLESVVVSMLLERNYRIAAAESCTGGLFMGRMINVPGASSVVGESYIAYSEAAKSNLLLVPEEMLRQYTAVSEPVAAAMAEGAQKISGAQVAVSITGLAGPAGMTDIPIGTVCFGCCINGHTETEHHVFHGNREKIRTYAVQYAFDFLRRRLLSNL